MVFLITHYYAVDERSIRIAFIGSSTTVAGAFGGCIAYGVGMMNGKSGLEGFRWLFIIEGSITMFAMVLLFLFLPDYPKREKWLSQSDKQFLEDRIAIKGGRATTAKSTKNEILNTLFSPRMIAHYFAYVCHRPLAHQSHTHTD
jgi:MFS family permease